VGGDLGGGEGVQAQSRGERERVLAEYSHGDREQAAGQGGHGEDLLKAELDPAQIGCSGQNRRVDEDDIDERQEGCRAAEDLGAVRRAAGADLEPAIEPALGWAGLRRVRRRRRGCGHGSAPLRQRFLKRSGVAHLSDGTGLWRNGLGPHRWQPTRDPAVIADARCFIARRAVLRYVTCCDLRPLTGRQLPHVCSSAFWGSQAHGHGG